MRGLYFDEYQPGQVIDHPLRRTVTEMDNVLFSTLTMNPQPLHIDFEYAKTTEFGRPLVNSIFTLGLLVGISVGDTTFGTLVANLGMTDIAFPAPVFHGDTVHCRSTVLATRPSRSRPGQGIVEFRHEAFNQADTLVATCRRTALMHARPATP